MGMVSFKRQFNIKTTRQLIANVLFNLFGNRRTIFESTYISTTSGSIDSLSSLLMAAYFLRPRLPRVVLDIIQEYEGGERWDYVMRWGGTPTCRAMRHWVVQPWGPNELLVYSMMGEQIHGSPYPWTNHWSWHYDRVIDLRASLQ